jgi:Flp pilus assembly protein TadB
MSEPIGDQPTQDPYPEELFAPGLTQKTKFYRIVTGTTGVLLILVGIVLGILPVVPGLPLIAVGMLMLVAASESSRHAVNHGERMLPRFIRRLLRRVTRIGQKSTPR